MANFISQSFFSVTFWIERQNLYIFHTCHPPNTRLPWQETIFSFGKFLWKWEILAIDHWSETFPCGKLLKHNCSWVLVHWETLFYCFFESTSPKSNSPISPREREIYLRTIVGAKSVRYIAQFEGLASHRQQRIQGCRIKSALPP